MSLEHGRLLVGIIDAAQILGLGRSKIYTLMDEGELQSIKYGKRRLITKASIDQFYEKLVSAAV